MAKVWSGRNKHYPLYTMLLEMRTDEKKAPRDYTKIQKAIAKLARSRVNWSSEHQRWFHMWISEIEGIKKDETRHYHIMKKMLKVVKKF